MTIPLRCWAEIDGAALRHNLRVMAGRVPRGTRILAVVKANAYGHGALPVAAECLAAGATWLGVANVHELAELRQGGFPETPVLLLSALAPGEEAAAVAYGGVPTVSAVEEGRRLDRAARAAKKRVRVHAKLDTGMGRLGCWHEQADAFLAALRRLRHLTLEGLCTHFASADTDRRFTRRQWEAFSAAARRHPGLLLHASNSPGLFSGVPCAGDLVRPGIMLYGAADGAPAIRRRLRQPLAWQARITLVRRVPAGRTVSYGATYRLRRPETLAVVAAGYADGYPRLLSNRGAVLVRGVRCPIRGRVTMDQIVVDVSRAGDVRPGEVAVLIGRQGKRQLYAEDVAAWAQTISYEIFTGISPRVPRLYRNFRAWPRGVLTFSFGIPAAPVQPAGG